MQSLLALMVGTLVSGGGWDLFLWDSMDGAQKGQDCWASDGCV